MRSCLKRSRIAAAVIAVITVIASFPASADEWNYDAAIYLWLSGLSGTLGVGRAGDIPAEATVNELAGYLDFTAAGYFEARNQRFVLMTDIYYVNLGAERDAEILRQTVKLDLDYSEWILALGGGYRVSEQFDALLTGRYYIFDIGATADEISDDPARESSQSWGDIFIGGRFHTVLGGKWNLSLRGDIGAGGSDFAWFGNAVVGYQFTDLFSLGLGYRILSLDYETGSGADYFKYDITTNGIGLEAKFSF
jgi:hypothetical protein